MGFCCVRFFVCLLFKSPVKSCSHENAALHGAVGTAGEHCLTRSGFLAVLKPLPEMISPK